MPLLSARLLAWKLGVPLMELRKLAREADRHYRDFSLLNREKGKLRILKVPDDQLKRIQRRILRRVLMNYELPTGLHGGVAGRSPRTNAESHLAKDFVINLDVRDFFPSVDHRQVARMFSREFGCGRDVRWLLTRLTTVDGQLPQGAPTSTMIANLLMATPVDSPTAQSASERGVAYTRFVDDITFSGAHPGNLINETAKSISRVGLRTWRDCRKLKIRPRSSRQEVTGLTVNSPNGPSVSRDKRDKIKAAINALKYIDGATEMEEELRSIRGRLNHLRQFNLGSAKRLQRQLDYVAHTRRDTLSSPAK